MSAETKDDLDRAFRKHLQSEWGDQAALITHWVYVAAGLNSKGNPRIMAEALDEQMPFWQVKGLLLEGTNSMEIEEDEDDLDA